MSLCNAFAGVSPRITGSYLRWLDGMDLALVIVTQLGKETRGKDSSAEICKEMCNSDRG